MGNLTYNIRQYFAFSAEELRALVIGIVVVAFLFSFDEWGVEQFDFWYGIRHLAAALLIVTFSMLVHQSVQRVSALSIGFKVEYRLWIYGLLLGLGLALLSNGALWFFAPGGIIVYHMAGHRLGSFRYGLNFWPIGMSGLAGPAANLGIVVLAKLLLAALPGNVMLQKLMLFNIWYALFSMLPIPPLDGSHLFFASRLMYLFSMVFFIAASALLYFLPGALLALLIAVLLAGVCWFGFVWMRVLPAPPWKK